MQSFVIVALSLVTLNVVVCSHSPSPSHDDVMTDIMKDIHGHKVMVYSKTYCPYSKKLKQILKYYEISDMKVVELNILPETQMREMQEKLSTLSGRTTVPQLFIDGHFVGGHDETRAMEDSGKLKHMLETAHALSSKTHEGTEF